MTHKNNITTMILFIMIVFNVVEINCQEEQQYKIKFGKDIYSVLPEIPSDYNIVKQNNLGTSKDNKPEGNILSLQKNTRFAQKHAPDFYALKSSDAQHQSDKYNYIKGKDIFTPEYLQIQSKKSQNQQYQKTIPHVQITKESTPKAQTQKKPQMIQNPPVPNHITQKKKNEEIISQKSAQLYKQFKNIEILKQKNLREVIKSTFETEILTQNFMKIIGYVVVGLIFAFAIIKKATKSQPSVPRRNQERSELRLRDTVEDDESESSSDSDYQQT